MKIKIYQLLICLVVFAAFSVEGRQSNDKQPNIIFFFIDDMGWRDWGGNGNTFLKTPSIDRIAKEGVVFDQGYVNAANCAPSRCALLSGQYSPRTHFYNVWGINRGDKRTDRLSLNDVTDGQVLADEKITFAEALKKAGYATAMYGKWHVSGHGKDGSGVNGGVSPAMQGFDDVLEHSAIELKKNEDVDTDPKKIFTYTKRAISFMEQSDQQDKPFLIYMAHHAVHGPTRCRPASEELFQLNHAENSHNNPNDYAGMMYDTDESIGMILDKLEEMKIKNNTVVIFLSDNGGVPSRCTQAPLRAYKGSYYEGGIRVPYIISWPGEFKPGRSDVPVMAIDLYPTMMELAGVKDIKSHIGSYPIDGVSLMPLLNGGDLKSRAMFWHFSGYLIGNSKYTGTRDPAYRQRPVSVIRKGDWKLHLFMEEWSLDGGFDKLTINNAVELYNLRDDISESNNLANSNPEKRNALLNELLNWHEKIEAPVPSELNQMKSDQLSSSKRSKRKKRKSK
jgi:arylsulfatase A-like enzyme